MKIINMLYQITLLSCCFGIEVRNNKIINSAPIGKWMIGKSFMYVAEWVNKKRGTINQIRKTL